MLAVATHCLFSSPFVARFICHRQRFAANAQTLIQNGNTAVKSERRTCMVKRDRDILIRFFVTANEKAVIQKRMELVGLTNMSTYLRKISMDGYLINADYTYIKEMNAELSVIGRNINQIAARANSTGIIYADDVSEIKKKQEEIWLLQKSILSNLR